MNKRGPRYIHINTLLAKWRRGTWKSKALEYGKPLKIEKEWIQYLDTSFKDMVDDTGNRYEHSWGTPNITKVWN